MLIISSGSLLAMANNCKDDYVVFGFNEPGGDYVSYTAGRAKTDTTEGYVRGINSDYGYSFSACLVAADGEGVRGCSENFRLWNYNIQPGTECWMTNLVKESGYNFAAVRGESNFGTSYSAYFAWSPDSVK